MDLVLKDLEGLGGKDNTPGLQGVAFFAPITSFAAAGIQDVGADGVTIAGPHLFKAGEGFTKIYVTLDSNEFNLAQTGERDSRGKEATLEMFHPGNTKEAAIFDRVCKNIPGILLLKTPDGVTLQMGSEFLPVEVAGSFGSGRLSSGRRGWTFNASSYQNGMQFYEGDITLKSEAGAGA